MIPALELGMFAARHRSTYSSWDPMRASPLFVAPLALGCTTRVVDYTADADTGTTHALISVERSVEAESPAAPRAAAFASFVRLPAFADAPRVLQLSGLLPELPAVGQCAELADDVPEGALGDVGTLAFLEVGDVSIATSTATTRLAPRAFPTVTDSIAGLVYSTRDRAAEPLPAATGYAVTAAGAGEIDPLRVEARAPRELEAVRVAGVALGDLDTLDVDEPLLVSWAPGVAGDVVWIELGADGAAPSACAFADEAGAGRLPAGALRAVGAGRVTVHRTRLVQFGAPDVQHGELRFDFSIGRAVTFER
jgi:hypothetical protein